MLSSDFSFFFFQAEDGIRDIGVTGVQTCALPISHVRLHAGRSLTGVPIRLPADGAIPAPEVPARDRVDRPFVADKELLQREATGGGVTMTIGYLVVLALALGLVALLTWGLRRLAAAGAAQEPPAAPRERAPQRRPLSPRPAP